MAYYNLTRFFTSLILEHYDDFLSAYLIIIISLEKYSYSNYLAGTKLTTENPEHVILSLRSSSCT